MEKLCRYSVVIVISVIVLMLNLIFPKANIPMIVVNIITCVYLAIVFRWVVKYDDELRFLKNVRYDILKAAFYHVTGQMTYRMELKGYGEYYFIYVRHLDVWYGLSMRHFKHKDFVYPRLAKIIRDYGLPIPNMDLDDGHTYLARSHRLAYTVEGEQATKEQVEEYFNRIRKEKETQGRSYCDKHKVIK